MKRFEVSGSMQVGIDWVCMDFRIELPAANKFEARQLVRELLANHEHLEVVVAISDVLDISAARPAPMSFENVP
jgi:hypothetical protein